MASCFKEKLILSLIQQKTKISLKKTFLLIDTDELGINKDRYKSLADEMDSTFAELAGY